MTDDIKVYIPFEKKNDELQTVAGYASTEAIDSQGEVVKLIALEKALPDYMKFANIREMHQWSAVGKAVQAKTDKKGLYIVGKIIDKQAWAKVKEKVYSGFSIGGKALKKVGNEIQDLILNEISLVDRPANPEAVFSLVKFDKGGEPMDIAKALPIAPYGVEDAPDQAHMGVRAADRFIAMATTVAYMITDFNQMGRKTKHLEKVLSSLKEAAIFEIQIDKMAQKAETDKSTATELQKLVDFKADVEGKVNKRIAEVNWTEHYFNELKEVL